MGRSFASAIGWTTLAPVACLVHCALTPLLVVAAPGLGASAGLEWGFLGATAVFATPSMAFSHRWHARTTPVLVVLAGMSFWVASLLGAFEPVAVELVTAVAAAIVATGLVWSSRLAHRARVRSCDCTDCRGEA